MDGRGGRTALLTALVAAAMLIIPGVASAAVLCVGTSGGACTQAEPDLNTALGAAHNGDTVQLGPGTYTFGGSVNATRISLQGVGVGGASGTTVTAAASTGVDLGLGGAGSSVSDLEVLIPGGAGSAVTGLEVNDGSVSNVAVVTASGFSAGGGSSKGISLEGPTATVSGATVNGTSIGIYADDAGSATVTAARITGARIGVEATGDSIVSVGDSVIALGAGCDAACTPLYAANSTGSIGEYDAIVAVLDTLVAGTATGGGTAGSPAIVETQKYDCDRRGRGAHFRERRNTLRDAHGPRAEWIDRQRCGERARHSSRLGDQRSRKLARDAPRSKRAPHPPRSGDQRPHAEPLALQTRHAARANREGQARRCHPFVLVIGGGERDVQLRT